jgi:hypothetical protein
MYNTENIEILFCHVFTDLHILDSTDSNTHNYDLLTFFLKLFCIHHHHQQQKQERIPVQLFLYLSIFFILYRLL